MDRRNPPPASVDAQMPWRVQETRRPERTPGAQVRGGRERRGGTTSQGGWA